MWTNDNARNEMQTYGLHDNWLIDIWLLENTEGQILRNDMLEIRNMIYSEMTYWLLKCEKLRIELWKADIWEMKNPSMKYDKLKDEKWKTQRWKMKNPKMKNEKPKVEKWKTQSREMKNPK